MLLAQHDRVADLLGVVEAAHGTARRHAFDELRAFLAVHETAEEMVLDHAAAEEREELPVVLAHCDEAQRRRLGERLRAAESIAPTRPHPSVAGSPVAQWAAGPVASLVDRTRDAVRRVTG